MAPRQRIPVVGGLVKVLNQGANLAAVTNTVNALVRASNASNVAVQVLQNPPAKPGTFSQPPTARVGFSPITGTTNAFMDAGSAPAADPMILVQRGRRGDDGEEGRRGFLGAMGPPGPSGPNGGQGFPGRRGEDGDPGRSVVGQQGIQGIQGVPGFGQPGRRGDDGDRGRAGPPGIGTPGPAGANGTNGTNGLNGIRGRAGDDGDNGRPGLNGQPGATGATGAAGTNGLNGIRGRSGDDGENGRLIYCVPRSGAQGSMGPPGRRGEDGDRATQFALIVNQGGGSGTGANPSATIGLSVINGSATTFMRSDAAPPLSQAIAPVWTAQHQWHSANAAGITGSQVFIELTSGSYGLAIAPDGTNQFTGIVLTDSSFTRNFEILYAGSTSGGIYGAAADSIVMNASGQATGGLVLSVADLAAISISTGGRVSIAPPAAAGTTLTINLVDNQSSALLVNTLSAVHGSYLSWQNSGTERGFIGTGSATLSGAALTDFILGADTGQLVLSTGAASRVALQPGGALNLSTSTPVVGGTASGGCFQGNQGTNTSPAFVYTSTGVSGEAFTASWSGTGANFLISSDIFIGNVCELVTTTSDMWIGTQNAHAVVFMTALTNRMSISATGAVLVAGTLQINGNIGFNGNAPIAKPSGFGTPTNILSTTNFPGTAATLAQCGGMISSILTNLKSYGLWGA